MITVDYKNIILIFAICIIYLCVREIRREPFIYEPKFLPKQFIELKSPYNQNIMMRRKHENSIVENSYPHEKMIGFWTNRGGVRNARQTGYMPEYHDKKTYKYIPSHVSTMDDFEIMREIQEYKLSHKNDNPVLEKSNKIDIDEMIY